jgi:holo-[acyl-carrier protein] synthase
MQIYSNKMIFGIGIDLVSVDRIEKLLTQFKEKFAERIFTANEILRANQIKVSDENFLPRVLFYAKRFAAKEAFSKALGLGIGRGIDFKDIEVENDDLGKPIIKILNGKEIFLQNHCKAQQISIHLSLTDEKSTAIAFVIIEKIS